MASEFQGRRILVVEDEPLITFLLEDALMIAGAQTVVQAARVAEALSAITTAVSEGGIDAAVIDYSLADGQSALPVADRLATLGVPFVFATGLEASEVNKGQHMNAPVITKPYGPAEVVSCLARIMQRGATD
ncbi:response regulator [Muricoccus pecuniae]|uniref:DNA-binding response OmpR family regulator n=1 Tax=Muricoccus pecuniae TaxID=693023 RepID=A0A840Y3R7_9PROT|nr:response regulator [Roseomonas pecuniae]MBB5694350.1 DNA-binding response OmpR family regulator [Roseomonas pecuniae]